MTMWHLRIACWIPKATNTHSEYIILVRIAFTLLQWLGERSSTLRYTYMACLVESVYCPAIGRYPEPYEANSHP
jgi:hypothetical protein